jgi:dipeptidyl aminopeptidase/acylaminoacyl peptidase
LISTKEGDGNLTYATLDSAYAVAFQWQGFALKDIYSINNATGTKQLVHKGWKGNLISSSYDGTKLLYYDEPQKKYFTYNASTGKTLQIAKDIKTLLFDEDNDVPDDPNAYGIAKWLNNNDQLIIYDRYDLWLVDANGLKQSVQLTNGRKDKIEYRFVETDNERKTLSPNETILLKGFSELDKSEQLVSLKLDTKQLIVINSLPMHITTIVAAKKSNDLVVTQEDEKNSPNLFHYTFNTSKQSPIAFTKINKQQDEYNWMTSQIVKWKSYTGKTAEGVLYLPENFDAKKKYPMIVYFYERNNQTLHNYLAPAPTPS